MPNTVCGIVFNLSDLRHWYLRRMNLFPLSYGRRCNNVREALCRVFAKAAWELACKILGFISAFFGVLGNRRRLPFIVAVFPCDSFELVHAPSPPTDDGDGGVARQFKTTLTLFVN